MKNKIILIAFLMHAYSSNASIQYYESFLTSGVATVFTPTSYVSWGCVAVNYVELDKIFAGDDGYIEFSIEPTVHVEVSLTVENNLSLRYGFIFKTNNVTTIQIGGVEINLPVISYVYTDVFKVLKCGELIAFYKNGEKIYEHCYTDTASNLLHTTHVTNSNNTRLSLEFESDESLCSTMFVGGGEDKSIAPDQQQSGNGKNESDDDGNTEIISGLPENKMVIVSVFNEHKIPIKQFRIRTSAQGTIPESHNVYSYIEKGFEIQINPM